MLNTLQTALHGISVAVLGIAVLVIIVSIIRPQLFKRIFQEFSERKYIVGGSVFVCLLSATIFIATQPTQNTAFVSENTKTTIHSVDPFDTLTSNEQEAIKIEDITVSEAIPFSKQTKEDAALPKGENRITQAGVDGLKDVVYTVTYKNGVEVSRVVKSENIKTPVIPEVTSVGTFIAPAAAAPATSAKPQVQQRVAPKPNPQPPAQQKKPSKVDSVCKNSQSWVCRQLR